jgi:hypothetical protein
VLRASSPMRIVMASDRLLDSVADTGFEMHNQWQVPVATQAAPPASLAIPATGAFYGSR